MGDLLKERYFTQADAEEILAIPLKSKGIVADGWWLHYLQLLDQFGAQGIDRAGTLEKKLAWRKGFCIQEPGLDEIVGAKRPKHRQVIATSRHQFGSDDYVAL